MRVRRRGDVQSCLIFMHTNHPFYQKSITYAEEFSQDIHSVIFFKNILKYIIK